MLSACQLLSLSAATQLFPAVCQGSDRSSLLQVGQAADNEVDMFAEVVQDAVSGSWHGRLHVSFQQIDAGQHACHTFRHTRMTPRKQCICQSACRQTHQKFCLTELLWMMCRQY